MEEVMGEASGIASAAPIDPRTQVASGRDAIMQIGSSLIGTVRMPLTLRGGQYRWSRIASFEGSINRRGLPD